MRRARSSLRILLGGFLCCAGVLALARLRPPERAVILGDACSTPARILPPVSGAPLGTAIVFHGLAASEAAMQPLGQSLARGGWRVYLLDLPGHGRSEEPFSYANADRCAAGAIDFLDRTGRIQPEKTIFAGHSLGGAVAVRLANRLPVAATVAISPAPLVLPLRMPSNLLILAGEFDLGPVKDAAHKLLAAAGGTRASPQDFIERRGVALRFVSGELHGSMVVDPRVWKQVNAWARLAVGARAEAGEGTVLFPVAAMLAEVLLLAGLVLLVAPVETALARALHVPPSADGHGGADFSRLGALGRWAVAAFSAVALIGLRGAANSLRPVRLEDGDWAALAALATGIILLALSKRAVFRAGGFDRRELALGASAGVVVVLAMAAALGPECFEATFSTQRIWRCFALAAFTWPYFLAEEAVIGEPPGRRRFLVFLGMRGVVWLAQLFALFAFGRWGLLLVLMVAELGIAGIGQRLAADGLRRRGAGPAGAALFDAILAAGMLGLLLPLT